MSTQAIVTISVLMLVFFVTLFGAYKIGADAALRDNRADSRIEISNQ
ncbi:MAG: hypothetical protein ACK5LJ_03705 [Paracoccus sp. (in: a-proteobacteria)]